MAHTLLLADDSVTIQRVIELTFADEDVQVVAVSDGDQAIARLESAPPDIVLADIGMPGRNGYEVARYVKQSPKLSHIPVVLLTGAFEPVDQARASEVGCDGVLAKPFEPQLVIGRVKELLAAESKKKAAPAAEPAPVAAAEAKAEPQADAPEHRAELDDYFDRLDVAFQKLSATPPAALRAVKPPEAAEPPAPVADQIDKYASDFNVRDDKAPDPVAPPPPPPPPAPPVLETPKLEERALEAAIVEAPMAAAASRPAPVVEARAPEARATEPPSGSSRPLPSIGDAFSAILAAERGGAADAGRPGWPASFAPPAPTLEITDEIFDRIVARVVERLSDQVVRDTTRQVVGEVAERLVREEIDRIKSALK